MTISGLPSWADWQGAPETPFTIGVEEELMLLDPRDWSLAFCSDAVVDQLPRRLRERVKLETHAAVIEINTGIHERVGGAAAELAQLRSELAGALADHGLAAAAAGTHPSAVWSDTLVSAHPRFRDLDSSMRVLARREPTLALHVHIGLATPHAAVRILNRLRVHLPLMLALSANSPFWQERDTGFASTRTILFQAFPRSGLPRAFRGYRHWVRSVDALIASRAITDPSYIWWDVRLQPRYGTVEVRIMDAQTTVVDTAALAALVQSLARMELERIDLEEDEASVEVIAENRFLAARDGMDANLVDPLSGERVSARALLETTIEACLPHAEALGCGDELLCLLGLAAANGAVRQRATERRGDFRGVTADLARAYRGDLRPEPAGRAA